MGFESFDRDGDGVISSAEFEQTRAERIAERSAAGYRMRGLENAPSFEQIDANGDGGLTPDELNSFHQGRMRGQGRMGPGM
jgi:Ca2+-binding EF-hand superfamily protein